jgi:hypothetical protein
MYFRFKKLQEKKEKVDFRVGLNKVENKQFTMTEVSQ